MKPSRVAAVAVLSLLVAAPSFAAVSKELAECPKGPAELLMTTEEKKQWKTLTSDDEAKAFIELFWARRDPTPGTPTNEFRRDFEERSQVANDRFRSGYGPGAKSDRGKVFILMGSPTKIRRSGSGPTSTIQAPTGRPTGRTEMPGGVQTYSPKEVWEFEQSKSQLDLGQPLVQIAFIDQYATGDWKMERAQTDFNAVFERVAASFVAQPDLKTVPVFAEATAAPAAAVAAVAAPPRTQVTTDAFRAAIEQARAATTPSSTLFITYGEFITPEGEHYVPVQLYLPASAGLSAGTPLTFFGSVEKEGGEAVAAFEEPASLTAATDGVFFARSVSLPPGKYRGSFGLAKDGKPVAVTSVPMQVAGLDKSAPSASALMLTNKFYPLTEAQNPTDPFAFGGLKVVPKSDGTFRAAEDLSYFFEVRNPGIDPATGQPKLSMKVSIAGTTADGKPLKMAGPAEMVTLRELKGVPGHYVVGEAIPLSSFKPGTYTVTLKVTDLTLKQSYDLSGSFRVIE